MNEVTLSANGSMEDLVAEVVDQFMERVQRGEEPQVEEYAERYPQAAAVLRSILPALQILQSSGTGIEDLGQSAEAEAGCLGDFRILRELGRGGMGIVYEAEQISLCRRVALKVLPFAATMDPRQLQRFQNEARAAASLDHTHIVKVHAVGCERGVYYYAMQFVDGQSLDKLIQARRQMQAEPKQVWHALSGAKGVDSQDERDPHALRSAQGVPRAETAAAARLSTLASLSQREYWRRLAEWGIQAAEALEHAHSLGIVHRDVKPANLMMDPQGKLLVTDFGLARTAADPGLTMSGDLLGTLRYMSPEQALAKHGLVDHRTDIYSLAATLYELATLEPAVAGQDRQELLRKIAFEEPLAPRRLNRAVPAELETILVKAMEKNPADRYATAKEMAEDLKRYLEDEPTVARRPSVWQRGRKWTRRHQAAVRSATAALLVVVIVLAGTAGWWVNERANQDSETLRQRANQEAETQRQRARLEAEAQHQRATQEAVTLRQQAETERAVTRLLGEADQTQKERKVPEALAKAKQAAEILAAGVRTPALEQRLQGRLTDLKVAAKLEDIRARQAAGGPLTGFDFADADASYAHEFQACGIDVNALPPHEAASRIRNRTVSVEMAAALDDWAAVIRLLKPVDEARRKGLLALARAADADPLRSKVRLVLEQGDAEALKGLLNEVRVEELPPPTVVVWAMGLRAAGFNKEIVELLRQSQRSHYADFWVNFQLALALETQQPPDLDGAIRFYSVAVAIRPESAVAHTKLGAAFRDKGRPDDAVAAFREAVRLEPNDAYANLWLCDVFMDMGQIDKAVPFLRQAFLLKPDLKDAHIKLGGTLFDSWNNDAVLAALRQAIHDQPNSADAQFSLGLFLENKRSFDEAIKAYREATHLKPDFAAAHLHLGMALKNKGLPDEAIAVLKKAISLRPQDPMGHKQLSGAIVEAYRLKKTVNLDEAIDAMRTAVRLQPADKRAAIGLGAGFMLKATQAWKKGQPREAIAACLEGLVLMPNFGLGHTALAYFLANSPDPQLRDPKSAVAAAKRGVELEPKVGQCWVALGMAHYRNAEWNEAAQALSQSLKLHGDDSDTFLFLAMTDWQRGDKPQARTWYDKAVKSMKHDDPRGIIETERFRAEAAELLGIATPKLNGKT